MTQDPEVWNLATSFALEKIAKEFSKRDLILEENYQKYDDDKKHRFTTAQIPTMMGSGALGGSLGAMGGSYARGVRGTKNLAALGLLGAGMGAGIGGVAGLAREGYAARRARKSRMKKKR